MQGPCPLDGDTLIVLFTLNDVGDLVYEYKRDLRDIAQDYNGREYGLFFANCEPQSAVSFELQACRFCFPERTICCWLSGVAATLLRCSSGLDSGH